ncbi:MAG: hypothetical protein WBF87_08965 [Mesorhizobium sp.]
MVVKAAPKMAVAASNLRVYESMNSSRKDSSSRFEPRCSIETSQCLKQPASTGSMRAMPEGDFLSTRRLC